MIRINSLMQRMKMTAENSVLRAPMKKRVSQMLRAVKTAMTAMAKVLVMAKMMERMVRVTNPPQERRRASRLMSPV